MIQRIQSIFLLLAAAAFGALFALPFASTSANESVGIFSDSVYNIMDNPALLGLAIAGTAIAVVAIFMFRKRSVQMRLGYLGMVVAMLIPVIALLYFSSQVGELEDQPPTDELGMFVPGVALVCLVLANYFIRKDEKLVKSMDRLR